jgi:EpsD family peptidyl-prolyl cis-trans isomerase
MTPTAATTPQTHQPLPPSYLVIVAFVAIIMAMAGCGAKKDKAASQTAAKVNKEEITVHQINFVLQQQRGLAPEQAETASRQILERLIDQELAVQRAQELKLDREPRVVQQLEAVKREILARAYAEKTGEAASKPTPEEIKKYFEDKPALFKERRIYSIQELAIDAKPEQLALLREQLQSSKSVNDFAEYLKVNNYRVTGNQALRAAEQLPANLLDTFAKMKDGQATLLPSPTGAQLIVLASSRSEPVDEARAYPAIEQFLLNDAKRKLIEADVKAMRASAKIEYVGKFAETAASAAAPGQGPTATALPAASPVEPTPASAGSAKGMSADEIGKGLGIKK